MIFWKNNNRDVLKNLTLVLLVPDRLSTQFELSVYAVTENNDIANITFWRQYLLFRIGLQRFIPALSFWQTRTLQFGVTDSSSYCSLFGIRDQFLLQFTSLPFRKALKLLYWLCEVSTSCSLLTSKAIFKSFFALLENYEKAFSVFNNSVLCSA